MSRKPKLPPLHLQQHGKVDSFSRCKMSLRSIPTPPEMAIEDLSDDARDLVIGSPIPQFSRDLIDSPTHIDDSSTINQGPDYPAIRVDSLDESQGKRNRNTKASSRHAYITYATGSSESFDDNHQVSDCRRLSPSPKLYRKTDSNHVKYFKISDKESAEDVNDDSVIYELNFNKNAKMSPTKQTRLSPILSPSSISPNLSPRTSPGSSPRSPRRKEQISVNCSPLTPRKGVSTVP